MDEAGATHSTTAQIETPRKAKQAKKAAASGLSANSKRRSNQVTNSVPAKKPKRSSSRCSLKNDDISKDLRRTKPGVAYAQLPNTIKADSTSPLCALPVSSIDFAACEKLDAGFRQEVQRFPKASIKSGNSNLGEIYQSAFVETIAGNNDGDRRRSSSTKPHSHLGNFDEMMGNVIDDDSFFKCLDARPKELAVDLEQWPSSDTVIRDDEKGEEEVGDQCYEGDSFFQEALEHDVPPGSDNSSLSSSLPDQATTDRSYFRDVEPSVYIKEPVSTLGDPVQHTTSPPPGSPDPESARDGMESEETDEFPIDEDEFHILDEQEYFEGDQRGDKPPGPDAVDSIACDRPDLVVSDPFADEDLDAELMIMSTTVSERIPGQLPPLTQTTPPRTKLQWMPPIPYKPVTPAQKPSTTIHNSSHVLVNPRMPLSALSPNTGAQRISPSTNGKPLPFIRPSFPPAVLPRSPITGLSPGRVIRTCFRIGEALNAASIALRNSTDAVIELFCRVKYSDRGANGYKQFFELSDLFTPEKPPSLNGVYTIWKGVDLWEYDSKLLLGARGRGRMARVLGRIKRGKANQGWEMTMLSVWEATWEVSSNLMRTRQQKY